MEAVIFCGIQATGKSTFYKERFFRTHMRISMDMLNTRKKENQFLQTCFLTQQRFVVDNTNPTIADRGKYIELAKQFKYKVIGYYFQSKVEDALARNRYRIGKENISIAGIRGVFKKIELPGYDEGFDELYYVEITDDGFLVKEWQNEI